MFIYTLLIQVWESPLAVKVRSIISCRLKSPVETSRTDFESVTGTMKGSGVLSTKCKLINQQNSMEMVNCLCVLTSRLRNRSSSLLSQSSKHFHYSIVHTHFTLSPGSDNLFQVSSARIQLAIIIIRAV